MPEIESNALQERMAAIRNHGLETASEIPKAIDQVQDWREYVKAHPIPIIIAAAAVGFLLVPSKPLKKNISTSNGMPTPDFAIPRKNFQASLNSFAESARGSIGSFVSTLIVNSIKDQNW